MAPLTKARSRRVWAAGLSLAMTAACTGKISGTGGTGGGPGTGAGIGTGIGGATGGAGGVAVTAAPTNAGALVMRRLNHDEYNNTVRDLLGTTLKPATDFPADGSPRRARRPMNDRVEQRIRGA